MADYQINLLDSTGPTVSNLRARCADHPEALGLAQRMLTVNAVLDGRTPVNPVARRTQYEQEGWKGFDPAAPAYTTEQVVTERKRRVVSVS